MNAFATPLDVLVVAPHPDDAEIGVGGTIVRCLREGLRVGVVDLTDGEPTPRGTPEVRARETAAATERLGLTARANLGLPNRRLQADLHARWKLAGVFRTARPRIVFAPYWDDAHPDHVAASRLCDDACFWAKLSRSDIPGEPCPPPRVFYFWSIHLRIHPRPSFVIDISHLIDEKLAAIACYESQFGQTTAGRQAPDGALPNPNADVLDDVRDRARYWGWTIGTRYAEPFASREEIGLAGVRPLLSVGKRP